MPPRRGSLERVLEVGGEPGRAAKLRAQKNSLDVVVVSQKAERFQIALVSIYFENGQEKRQHDRGIDEDR